MRFLTQDGERIVHYDEEKDFIRIVQIDGKYKLKLTYDYKVSEGTGKYNYVAYSWLGVYKTLEEAKNVLKDIASLQDREMVFIS